MKIMLMMDRFIERIEGAPVRIAGWVASFAALVAVRIVLEGVSQRIGDIFAPSRFDFWFHSFYFYAAAFLGVAVIIHLVSGIRMLAVLRFVLVALVPFILLPPLLDLVASGGAGAIMAYRPLVLVPGDFASIWRAAMDFLLHGPLGPFFWNNWESGTLAQRMNYGIRIELILVAIVTLVYVFVRTRSAFRALLVVPLLSFGTFLLGSLPYLVAALGGESFATFVRGANNMLGSSTSGVNIALLPFLAALITLQLVLLAHRSWPLFFRIILHNARWGRMATNGGFLIAGIAIGWQAVGYPTLSLHDLAIVFLACVAIFSSWLWAVALNDRTDIRADRISAPERPLPSGTMSIADLRGAGILFLLVALAASYAAGEAFFLMTVLRVALGYLYTAPPLRLKRVPIFANLVLAGVYLARIVGGFLLFRGLTIFEFPWRLVLVIVVLVGLATEFKDIKDIAGDRVDGVPTLANALPEPWGLRIIALLGFAAFCSIPLVYADHASLLALPAAAAGLCYAFFVLRKPYRDGALVAVHAVFGALFAAIVAVTGLQL